MRDDAGIPAHSPSREPDGSVEDAAQPAMNYAGPAFPTAAGGPRDSEATTPTEMPPPQMDGVALVKAGNLAAAEVAFRDTLRVTSGEPGVWHNLAVALARQGKLAAAVEHFEEALRLKPESADTHRNLALALCQQGKRREGESHWREAVRIDPGMATAHHELGNALRISGRLEEAVSHLREAVRLRADDAEAWQDLGMALAELKLLPQARESYETALRIRPKFPEARNNLGILLEDQGDHAGAEALYRGALEYRPQSADTLNNLGVSLSAQRRFDEAVACYRRALEFSPVSAMAWNNLGNALRSLGEVEESITCLRKAIAFRADYAEAHNNLGIGLMQLGRHDEAMDAYTLALHLRPDYPEAHLNRSLAWLGEADFSRGWTEYEWRWSVKPVARRPYAQPLWSGARAPDKTLFVYFEQGLGDTFQFIRYIEAARRKVRRIVVEVQGPLVPLISKCQGIDEVIPAGATPPPFDLHLPLMSLAGALGTRLETIPDAVPYLSADPERVQSWRERLSSLHGLRVGIVWQGNPEYRGDRLRSIPLTQFLRLAGIPDVQLVSLQRGFGLEQLVSPERSSSVVSYDDLDACGGAFMDTAAILKSLDLVITSDTALAHLAGGLGTDVWVALPFASDWRWLRNREDTPWYPTMRLFRQSRPGDWDEVFDRIAGELAERAADRSCRRERDVPSDAASAEFRKGTQAAGLGQHAEAIARLTAALELCHDYPEAHHNLGVVHAQLARRDEAIDAFRQALRLHPGYGEAAGNLGLAYLESGQPDKAVSILRHAARCGHDRPDVFNHLGVALYRVGNASEAVEAYRTAIRLSPGFSPAHINLAQAHLALGQFQEAWLEIEWKWTANPQRRLVHRVPRWSGEPLDGRKVLVYADEPLDDVLQYLRFVRLVSDRGGSAIVACQPELVQLVARGAGVESAVSIGEPLPQHDAYVPLLSLPWLWMKSSSTIPTSIPYLSADPALREKSAPTFRSIDGPRVGLWWPGIDGAATRGTDGWLKECVFRASHSAEVPIMDFHVHVSQSMESSSLPPQAFFDDRTGLRRLPELAAMVSHLDLLITRDSRLAQLAGALGVSVCLLLPRLVDARWPMGAQISPWYPAMRLMRIPELTQSGQAGRAEAGLSQLIEMLHDWRKTRRDS